MIEKKIVIQNETGIHARPASVIVREASKYQSGVIIRKGDKNYNAKSTMNLMLMVAKKGEEITLIVNGIDEDQALEELTQVILNGLE